MDVINLWGRTRDIVSVGLGNTTLDDILAEAAQGPGPDRRPRRRAREGDRSTAPTTSSSPSRACPRSTPRAGSTTSASPPATARRKRDEYTQNDYHKVTDEVKPDWDLSGAVEDLRLLFEVGYRVAQGDAYPRVEAGDRVQGPPRGEPEGRRALVRIPSVQRSPITPPRDRDQPRSTAATRSWVLGARPAAWPCSACCLCLLRDHDERQRLCPT